MLSDLLSEGRVEALDLLLYHMIHSKKIDPKKYMKEMMWLSSEAKTTYTRDIISKYYNKAKELVDSSRGQPS